MFRRFKHQTLPRHILVNVKNKGLSISAFTELFMWIFLLALVIYAYLPEISSLFGITNLEALTRKPAFQRKQHKGSEYRLELTMQIVLGTGEDIDTVLVDSLTSKQYIVPAELRKTQSSDISAVLQENNATDNDTKNFLDTYTQSVQIKCSAPFPIEFLYEGSGRPNLGKIRLEKRNIKVLEEMSQYFYIAILDFEKNVLEEVDSGKYICRSLENSTTIDRQGKHFDSQVSIHLFVPGEKILIYGYFWDNKDVKNNSSVVIINHNMATDGTEISLPCGVSDPSTKVTLYRKEKVHLVKMTPVDHHIKQNDVVGFTIPVNLVKDWPNINFLCKAHPPDKELREIPFDIKLSGLWNSQISPPYSQVILRSGQLPIQVFKCAAEEPLILKWLDGPTTHVSHKAYISGNEMYRASFIGTPEQFIGNSPVARFECSRVRDGMVIHTWKWIKEEGLLTYELIISPRIEFKFKLRASLVNVTRHELLVCHQKVKAHNSKANVTYHQCILNSKNSEPSGVVVGGWGFGGTKPFLRFNEKQREFSCCVKNAEPLILVQACSSMLECRLKASLQSKTTSSSWTNIIRNKEIKGQVEGHSLSGSNKDNSCAVWAIPNEFQAGFIKCTEGRDNSNGDYFQSVELPPVYLRWNDDVVIFRDGQSSKPLDHLIRIRVTTDKTTEKSGKSSNHKKLECFASSMVFAKGFRWKIFTWSGEIFDNVQLKTLWGNRNSALGIISYREAYLPQEGSYYGVLLIKTRNIVKPILRINSKENQIARLELEEKIKQVQCEAAFWNDTDVWVASTFNKSMVL